MVKRPTLPKLPTTPITAPATVLGGVFTETPAEESSFVNPSGSTVSLGRGGMKKSADDDLKSAKTPKGTKKGWSLNGRAWARSQPNLKVGRDTSDVGGPRFDAPQSQSEDVRCAGDDPEIYLGEFVSGRFLSRLHAFF